MLVSEHVMDIRDNPEQLLAEIERAIRVLPEDQDKGKLRGLFLRLRESCTDARRFKAELQKLAALSETLARRQPATRLHQLLAGALR